MSVTEVFVDLECKVIVAFYTWIVANATEIQLLQRYIVVTIILVNVIIKFVI